tara:strand:+ start:137 stop:748 length:612 start_codon:yes stop_codon:yes gene_type:complete
MEWEALAYLLALLCAGVITPGPNNMTCTVHAAIHGKKSNYPLIAGMALGFISIHFICGLAVDSFDQESTVGEILNIIGSIFMFLIAIAIIVLGQSNRVLEFPETIPKIGFKTGVLMQYVNGKEWMLVFMIMSKLLTDFGGGILGIITISTITTSGGIIAMLLWSNVGSKIKSKLEKPGFLKLSFTTLGILLFILATILTVREI